MTTNYEKALEQQNQQLQKKLETTEKQLDFTLPFLTHYIHIYDFLKDETEYMKHRLTQMKKQKDQSSYSIGKLEGRKLLADVIGTDISHLIGNTQNEQELRTITGTTESTTSEET